MQQGNVKIVMSLVTVVFVASLFRLYDIQHYPPGLFPDEAANGEDALLILQGDMRPFYERGNGREALFFYLQAISIKLFGIGVWQMHIVSAIVGILTVLAIYFATRPFFGRLAGMCAALLLATSHWHVTLSRTGFRAILIPLFVAAFTAFVGYTILSVKQVRKVKQARQARRVIPKSYVFAALAGVTFMGGFYSYIAYRVMVGVVGGVVVLLLLAAMHPKIGFPHFKRYGGQILVAIIAGILVFLPLGWYFVQHPDAFIGRAGQVSIFNTELQRQYGGGTLLGTLLFSLRETILSFFVGEGDVNWRHNVAGFPLLNPFVGILFLLGFAWAINGTVMVAYKMIKGKKVHLGMVYPYLLLMIVEMLFPVITTAEGIPHGLRSLGLLVPVFVLAGTACAVMIHWVQRHAKTDGARAVAYGIVGGLLVVGSVYDGALYFLIARHDSEAAYAYRADLTDVAAYINTYAQEHSGEPRPYMVLDAFSLQTIHFLTSVQAHDYLDHPDEARHRYERVEPETSQLTPPEPGRLILFTQSTIFDADRYLKTYGEYLDLVESRKNRFNQEIMRVYRGKVIDGGEAEIKGGEARFDLDA